MAVDEVLLDSARRGGSPTLRLYGWKPAALSLGYFQDAATVDRAACAAAGIDVVRRPTGGRAVLHADEVTYAVALPPSHPIAGMGVVESYRALSEGLLQGLALLGIGAEQAKAADTHAGDAGLRAACFGVPSWYELTVNGRKVAGSAQVRRHGALLQHGSVPLRLDGAAFYRLFQFDTEEARERAGQHFAARAGGLCEACGTTVTDLQLRQAMVQGFAIALSCQLVPSTLTDDERSAATELMRKHQDSSWVFQRGKGEIG